MKVSVDVSLNPMGSKIKYADCLAACKQVFLRAGLTPRSCVTGINVQGPWQEVFAAIEQCHQAVHDLGAPRISTAIRMSTNVKHTNSTDDKINQLFV